MTILRGITILVASLLAAVASVAQAAIVTVPTDLSPGDFYRLAFVTSGTRNASSNDIAVYNTFVTGIANAQTALSDLGTTWYAIASTSTKAARDNTSTNPGNSTHQSVPIYRLDGTRIADNNTDLWDGRLIPLLPV